MTKLEAIIQPSKFESVKEVLMELVCQGMTILEVRGHGRQKGHTETYRGREYSVDLLPKIKIELVISDELVDSVVDAIIKTAATGKIGDGKILLRWRFTVSSLIASLLAISRLLFPSLIAEIISTSRDVRPKPPPEGWPERAQALTGSLPTQN